MIEAIRRKNLHTWMTGYARHLVRTSRRRETSGPKHLLFAFCDHYEPLHGNADRDVGLARVRAWEKRYVELASRYVDADGRHPRHSFFFPGEQYDGAYLDSLASLAARGFGEVELHLHHDGDTREALRESIRRYLESLSSHGHFSRDRSGAPRFGFIHGNWALANGRRDGRWCGVDDEIPLLFELGCYADYTFPSAPDECQPNIVNRIYWPDGDFAKRRGYETGAPAKVGEVRRDRILMIGGPLALARRNGGFSLRIESSAVTAADPPTPERVRTWVEQGIHVDGRPEWVFVKVHTHGAPEAQAKSLLGEGGHMLHRELTSRYNDGRDWVLHYVTAREMYNVALAAMAGKDGDPSRYRDFELAPPPVAATSRGEG